MADVSKMLDFWNENGYYVLEDLWSPEEIDTYSHECDRIAAEYNPEFQPFQYPHKVSELFVELMKHKRIVRTCEVLIGSEVEALQTWMYFKPPGELGRDVHQNSFYTQAAPGEIINVSTAIDDADEENGCLYIYPGSQVEPILPIHIDEERVKTNPDRDGFRNERGKAPVVPEKYEKRYLPIKAGSACFIHSHVLHGSEQNRSKDRFRRATLTGYLKKGAPYRPGKGGYNRQRISVYD